MAGTEDPSVLLSFTLAGRRPKTKGSRPKKVLVKRFFNLVRGGYIDRGGRSPNPRVFFLQRALAAWTLGVGSAPQLVKAHSWALDHGCEARGGCL